METKKNSANSVAHMISDTIFMRKGVFYWFIGVIIVIFFIGLVLGMIIGYLIASGWPIPIIDVSGGEAPDPSGPSGGTSDPTAPPSPPSPPSSPTKLLGKLWESYLEQLFGQAVYWLNQLILAIGSFLLLAFSNDPDDPPSVDDLGGEAPVNGEPPIPLIEAAPPAGSIADPAAHRIAVPGPDQEYRLDPSLSGRAIAEMAEGILQQMQITTSELAESSELELLESERRTEDSRGSLPAPDPTAPEASRVSPDPTVPEASGGSLLVPEASGELQLAPDPTAPEHAVLYRVLEERWRNAYGTTTPDEIRDQVFQRLMAQRQMEMHDSIAQRLMEGTPESGSPRVPTERGLASLLDQAAERDSSLGSSTSGSIIVRRRRCA